MHKLMDDLFKAISPYVVELATALVTAGLAWLRLKLQHTLADDVVEKAGQMHASTRLVAEHAEALINDAHPLLRPITKRGASKLVGRAIERSINFDERPTNPGGRKS